jgi:hypothetical protein
MIPVIWWGSCRGNWDHGTLMQIFDKHPDVFHQINDGTLPNPKKTLSQSLEKKYQKPIIIVAGCPDTQPLRDYLLEFHEGIVILTSEEDAYFNWQYAIPDHLDIWTQYYSPISKAEIKTRLLLGAPSRIKDYKINSHLEKKYLWSFVGQVQNPFRQQCVETLRNLPYGFLHIADAFGGEVNGIEYQQYLNIMCQSHYVICPAGSMCVDSFRLYEAMQCGAIPLTDSKSPRDPIDFRYWDEVYKDHTICEIGDWAVELPIFFKDRSLEEPHSWKSYNEWWFKYQKDLEQKLLKYAAN